MVEVKFKLIIFDWSGVIADTFDNYYVSAMEIFKAHNVPILSKEEAREEFRQPYMAFYNKFIPGLSRADANAIYIDAMLKCPLPKIFPGIKDIILRLAKENQHMAVISGDAKDTLLVEIKEFEIEHAFKDVLWDVHDKTETVSRMIKEHKLKPEEVVFVGDSMHEVEVGKRVGCKSCAVTWGFVRREKLEKLKPDFLVDTPEELIQVLT